MEASALHLVCRFSLAEAKKKAKKRRKKQRPHEQRDLAWQVRKNLILGRLMSECELRVAAERNGYQV